MFSIDNESYDSSGSTGSRVEGLDAALPRRASFFETVPGLYLILDPELRILDATDAYLKATMTERSEIVGRSLFDVFPDNPSDLNASGESNLRSSIERAIRSGKPDSMAVQKYDVRAPLEQGGEFETRYWSPVNTPVFAPGGNLSHIVHQVEDVTGFVNFQAESEEQRQDNQELRGALESMQAEILRRSAELHDSNVQLRAASDAKNMFLSRMSHELRSPLTAVIGYSEILQLDAGLGKEDMQAADAIYRAGAHLLELINEVLDITRVETGFMTMSIEPVAIENAIESAIELMTPLANSAGIALDLPDRPSALYVKADPQRLTQVIVNLLSNAIKYNRPQGRVAIEVSQPTADLAQLTVSDTGAGINEAGLTKLFQPFERLGAEATEIEGTGLGLSLTRGLVEEMGGRIEVKSEVDVGTSFTVELTCVQPALMHEIEADNSATLSVVEYPEPRTVLYIEDAAANLRLVERVLQRRPQVTVLSAMVGAMGLELARKHAPDLVLLDLHLPDVNGSQILAQLKADPATRSTPIVVLSADATNRQRLEVLALGATSYLTKPIGVGELLRAVDEVLA